MSVNARPGAAAQGRKDYCRNCDFMTRHLDGLGGHKRPIHRTYAVRARDRREQIVQFKAQGVHDVRDFAAVEAVKQHTSVITARNGQC